MTDHPGFDQPPKASPEIVEERRAPGAGREFGTWDVPPNKFLGVYRTEHAGDVLQGSVTETPGARTIGLRPELMVVLLDDVWMFAVLDTSRPDQDGQCPVLTWNPGVPDGGLKERIADSYGEFAVAECRQKLGLPT